MDPIPDWLFFVACSSACSLYFLPSVAVSVLRSFGSRAFRYFHCIVCTLLVLYHIHSSFKCATTVATLMLLLPLIFVAVFFSYSSLQRVKFPYIYIYVRFYPKRIGKLSAATVFRLRREHFQRVPVRFGVVSVWCRRTNIYSHFFCSMLPHCAPVSV